MKFLRGKYLLLAIVATTVVILDQITKVLAIAYLKPLAVEMNPADRAVSVIDGFFRLVYAENTGAAFSLLSGLPAGARVPLFALVTLLALGFMFWLYRKLTENQHLMALSLSLLFGGALGNLIDRIRLGYVVDFVQWYVTFSERWDLKLIVIEPGEKRWPTFNVADAAITVGIVLLLLCMLFERKAEQKSPGQGGGEPPADKS